MRWNIAPSDPDRVCELAKALSLSLPAARVLWSRGYRDLDLARKFLNPSIEDLHDPLLMKDMAAAVDRLSRAIQAKESILLYGDYDVDGTTSVVLLKKSIELLGGKADFHVPHRLRDGYGMRSEVVEEAAASGVSLIVSVDTGIRANASGEACFNVGDRCDRHRPSPARGGNPASASRPESQPDRLRLSRKESLRSRSRTKTGAGVAGAQWLG